MSIELDHLTVPASDMRASAEHIASILYADLVDAVDAAFVDGAVIDGHVIQPLRLGVQSAPAAIDPFHAVHVNNGLTLDFDQVEGSLPVRHTCFRVDDASFDGIVARVAAAGVPCRGLPFGPDDGQIDTRHGGRIVYRSLPDGHVWEAPTVSYARSALDGATP